MSKDFVKVMSLYTVLSDETIDVSALSEEERKHISQIECLITNDEDYFEVWRQADVPFKERKSFTAKNLQELHNSPCYKVVLDLLTRYHQKLFSQNKLPIESFE